MQLGICHTVCSGKLESAENQFIIYYFQTVSVQHIDLSLTYVLQRTVRFCEQLATVIPNAHVYYRRGLALKRVIPQCIARNFTYLMVINEDRKVPSIL